MEQEIGKLPARLDRDLKRTARAVRSSTEAEIITHIDADGITAGSIASMTLERLGIEHCVRFEKKITKETIEHINSSESGLIWICDLGSGYLSMFDRHNVVITDHHVPDPDFRKSQTSMDEFTKILHLNPHTYGVDGSFEACGACMTYLLSRTIDPSNRDLAYLGVIGAIGDFQDNRYGRLVGYDRIALSDAVDNKDVAIDMDLRFFGRDSRNLVQYLQYNNDPHLGGLSDDREGCLRFYSELDIETGKGRTWSDLPVCERERAVSRIMHMIDDEDTRSQAYGEVYTLTKYGPHSGLRDSKEYATVLNSCGRYDDAETGMRICKGDMSAFETARKNRDDHRRNISNAMTYVRENHLIRERRFIQYFDSGSEIRETVVGIVAGMILNSGDVRRELPIIALADSDDGVKVSARATRTLIDKGLDLSYIMKRASEMVGGFGGGHDIAAGATIPENKKEAFLEIVEDLVSIQLT